MYSGGSVILTVNAGSSSLKVSVFSLQGEYQLGVSIEDIGAERASVIPNAQYGSEETITARIVDHRAAAIAAYWWLNGRGVDVTKVRAIGHRVVHGGERYNDATVIDSDVIAYLTAITPLAPNHLPVALTCITEFQKKYADAVMVACFDTAFFHDIPKVAQLIAVPKEVRDAGVRRYGFHGLSYEYLLNNFEQNEGEMAARGRVIMAHLGSGASVAALKDGKPIDMSMGFTPASGVVMSTRTGDVDPGVIDFLLREKDMTAEAVSKLVYKQSGLLAVSEKTADMHSLLLTQATDEHAAQAIELFCYSVKKHIGAYIAALGGVDSIIFTAGIGERSAEIRRRILSGLEFAGVALDAGRNERGDRLISAEHSRVGVHVIPTHEDTVIAQKTERLYKETA